MLFRTSIPSSLQEYPNVYQFMDVLDSLQSYKQGIIAESLHVNNPGVLMDKKWILKFLEEFGINNIPLSYPIMIIRQVLLNVGTLHDLRGSKLGLQFYCSLFSLGEVTVDDSQFFSASRVLLPNSLSQGFITNDSTKKVFYLLDDTSLLNPKVRISFTIKSKYFNGRYPFEEGLIKDYIEKNMDYQLGFSPSREVTYNYLPREEFYFHELLNPYFV